MASSIQIVLVGLLCLLCVAANDSDLRLVFVLAKHGSTTPVYPIPTMSWADWVEPGPMVLTGMGMRQHYILGHELRRRYDEAKMFNQSLLIHQTLIRSVNYERAIESAQAFIQGFAGTNAEKLSAAELKFAQPPTPINNYFVNNIANNPLPYGMPTLPYHNHYPQGEDAFDWWSCPHAMFKAWKATEDNPHIQNITRMYDTSFKELVKRHYKVNENILEFPHYIPLLTSIVETHRLYRDTWLNEAELFNVTDYYQRLYFYLNAADKEANAYRATPILNFISKFLADSFNDNIKNPERQENLKAGFVFMEDVMLLSLLAHLNVSIAQPIPPASIVSFEVHGPPFAKSEKPEAYTVVMKYNDREYMLGSCSHPQCSFTDFLQFIISISVDKVSVWCKSTNINQP